MDEKKELLENSGELEKTTEQIPDIEIPTLRTYKSDINQTVNKDKITSAKILIAEQNRKIVEEDKNYDSSIKRPTNILVLILSIILVVVAIGGIAYFGYTKVVKEEFETIKVPQSFLFIFDNEKFVDASKDNFSVMEEAKKVIQESSSSAEGNFTDIIFYKTNNETKEKSRITSSEFFRIYEVQMPTNITRSIGNDFVYGLYKTEGRAEPFLVVDSVDYEVFYSSMFVWESTLALDIKDLFPNLETLFDISRIKKETESIVVTQSTSTASTTSSSTSTKIVATTTNETVQNTETDDEKQKTINRTIRFIDMVFSNKDARAVRDESGKPFFYYSFIDKSKILFAQDPKILGEVSRKIKEKNLVR